MASAVRYTWTRSDGSVGRAWRAKWSGGSKRGFALKGDAIRWAQDREAEQRHGLVLEQTAPTGRTTVAAWGATWLSQTNVRPSTQAMYGHAVQRINKRLGDKALASLRPTELNSWRVTLEKQDLYAKATVSLTVSVLAMMLRAAVADGLLPKSPLQAQRSREPVRVVEPEGLLTLPQVRAWAAAMPEYAQAMPLMAAMTGLRQGELLGLRSENVNFLRRQVQVVEQMVSPPHAGRPTWGAPKTVAGRRTVPLAGVVVGVLAEHMARFPSPPGEPIFLTKTGQRWRRAGFRTVWHQARVDAGLPEWVHWHGLRDVAASGLVRSGVDIKTIMAIMGHTSSEETLRIYAKLWGDSQDNARQALDGLYSDSLATGVRDVRPGS